MRLLVMTFLGAALMMAMSPWTSIVVAETTGGIDLLCSRAINSGSFNGHLTSVSWSSRNFVDFCIDKACAHVPQSTLEQKGATVEEDEVWRLSQAWEKLLPKPGEPVTGFYFFDLMKDKEKKRIHLYMQDTCMLMEDGHIMWTVLVSSFTLVHEPPLNDGAMPYMFAIDKVDQRRHTIFFSMTLNASNDYNLNLDQRDKHYFATWDPSVNNTLRLVPKPLGAPRFDAFSKLPKGFWADVDNGTVFLFDDQLGCVFAVAGWSKGLNLSAKYDQNSTLSLDFKAIGTPYEAFFRCPADKYPEKSLGLGKSKDRCNVIGKKEDIGSGGDDERGSGLLVFLIVALVLLAILSLMVIIACRYAKSLVMKNSFKRGQDDRRFIGSTDFKSPKSSKVKLTTPTTTTSKSSTSVNLQSLADTKSKVGGVTPKSSLTKIKVKG